MDDIFTLNQLVRAEIRAFIRVHTVLEAVFDSIEGQEDVIPDFMIQRMRAADEILGWLVQQGEFTQPELDAITDDLNRERMTINALANKGPQA